MTLVRPVSPPSSRFDRSPTQEPAVVIAGAGPTGLTIATFLGQAGIPTLVVERNPGTTDEPKAVSIDEESLRLLQAAGLYESMQATLLPGTGTRYYGVGGALLANARGPNPPHYGHPIKSELNQPDFERALLEGLGRFPCVRLRFTTDVLDMRQDEQGVTVGLGDPRGARSEVRTRFVVGADGGRSTVRKELGIRMSGSTFEEPWVVIDTRNDPHRVRYALHIGDPHRPCVIIPGRDGLCRYEFLLLPGESPDAMLELRAMRALLAPYRALEAADIVRAKVYTFHALVADQWRVGRVLLAGDAAHMMPPFAGQGLNSGLRDAHNLGWKLVMVLQGLACPGLLDTYQQERRAHAIAMIQLSVRQGTIMMTRNRGRAIVRDAFFRSVGQVWPVKQYFTEMRYKPQPRYRAGLMVGDPSASPRVGMMLPQPRVLFQDGQTRLLDTALGSGFALVAPARGENDPFVQLTHPLWNRLGVARVAVYPEQQWPAASTAVERVVDVENRLFPAVWPHGDAVLLVRPDRYVAGGFVPERQARFADELLAALGTPTLEAGLKTGGASTQGTQQLPV